MRVIQEILVMGMLLAILGKIGVVAAIAVAFTMGLLGTVYFSMRSPEVQVPEVVGKNRFDGETALEDAGLHIRVRASRYSSEAKADTILEQSPRGGEVVKVGQTIAVMVSRATARPGEVAAEDEARTETANDSKNQNSKSSNKQVEGQDNAKPNKNVNTTIANKNANNRKANASKANTNVNVNSNANRNANGNVNRSANSNQNANANRNANVNANNRNTNAVRSTTNNNANSNTNRRPVTAVPTPPAGSPINTPRRVP